MQNNYYLEKINTFKIRYSRLKSCPKIFFDDPAIFQISTATIKNLLFSLKISL